MTDRLLVFGTGSVAERFMSIIDLDKVDILAFINTNKPFENFHGYRVLGIEEISDLQYDYIVIASGYTVPIRKILKKANVEESKVVCYIFDDDIVLNEMSECLNDHLNSKYNRNLMGNWIRREYSLPSIAPAVLWDESRCLQTIYKDSVREQTVKLLHDIMSDRAIDGAVAEVGVFRGDFTVVLDKIFKTSRLYLFDTFEGFSNSDIEADSTIDNKQGENAKFKDTSVDFVLSRLDNVTNVVVKKGYFPDTFDREAEEEEYSFVSIDLNIAKPTRDALNRFWPRVVSGGYIMVSCYYAPFYEGTRREVNAWCERNNITPIPMADYYGSVLLAKQ